MNEKEFLAKWSVEKSLHEAWAQFIKNKIELSIKQFRSTSDADSFIKIPAIPRLKTNDSLLGKAFNRNKNYADPYLQIEDKVGVRFVVLLASQIQELQKIIENCPDWEHSLDKDFEADQKNRPLEFTYQSIHYVLKAKQDIEVGGIVVAKGTPCEVQLRTLLQHAHSELTHDNIYKVQEGTVVTSKVHRTIAKSMALIETVDDFFAQAVEELKKSTEPERNALRDLTQLYAKHIGVEPGSDKSNAIILQKFRGKLGAGLVARVEALLTAKPFITDQIKKTSAISHSFRQPWILFAYLLVDSEPIQTNRNWPLTPDEIQPVYVKLGKRMT